MRRRNVLRSCSILDTRFGRRAVMRVHRACLFAAAALGAVVLFGCGTPTPVTKFDQAKDMQNDGKYSDAIAKYKVFISEKEYPGLLPFAQYNIARSYRSLGKLADARDAYKKVTELYPTSEPAQWAKDEMRELDKAMQSAPPARMMPSGSMPMSATPAPK
jgi:TolA-binding protein